jgi:SagB-type dehydrogenase family enzyme
MALLIPDVRADISLPKARVENNPLLELLQRRRSSREFADRPLDLQLLADLLWAAFGISNRDGYRTAPSARNWREIDIYVALAQGLYRYIPHTETLELVSREDVRASTGKQDFVAPAPLNLVYVADREKMGGASSQEQDFYGAADAGVISQNVYLFCTSAGLATVVRGLIDRPALAKRMNLRPTQRVILAQTVGYPS